MATHPLPWQLQQSPGSSFPRRTWSQAGYSPPPYEDDWEARMLWAAQDASLAWTAELGTYRKPSNENTSLPATPPFDAALRRSRVPASTVDGQRVDATCFLLAVVDKVLEYQEYMQCQIAFGPRPLPKDVGAWKKETNVIIEEVIQLACAALAPSPPPCDPDDVATVCLPIRKVLNFFFDPYLDVRIHPKSLAPCYDFAMLSRFDPVLRPRNQITWVVLRPPNQDGSYPPLLIETEYPPGSPNRPTSQSIDGGSPTPGTTSARCEDGASSSSDNGSEGTASESHTGSSNSPSFPPTPNVSPPRPRERATKDGSSPMPEL